MVQLKALQGDWREMLRKFQFQYGTIKRDLHHDIRFFTHTNFNSNMVQLKGKN